MDISMSKYFQMLYDFTNLPVIYGFTSSRTKSDYLNLLKSVNALIEKHATDVPEKKRFIDSCLFEAVDIAFSGIFLISRRQITMILGSSAESHKMCIF
mgnify:CR=1 FL=1